MDFSGFSGSECLLYGRGEARRRRRRRRGGGGGGGGGEAEARRRRGGGGGGGGGEAEARRGEAAAAPRRPRAAVINDAFPRPHANFQIFYSKSCF